MQAAGSAARLRGWFCSRCGQQNAGQEDLCRNGRCRLARSLVGVLVSQDSYSIRQRRPSASFAGAEASSSLRTKRPSPSSASSSRAAPPSKLRKLHPAAQKPADACDVFSQQPMPGLVPEMELPSQASLEL